MNTKKLLIVAAAGLAAYLVIQATRGKRFNTLSGQNVVPGSAQDRMLADQCAGWSQCVAGWGG
jgi:hypothetical protein